MTLCAEFNFVMDPESAYIVLEEFLCPTYVATWEYSCRNGLPWVSFSHVKEPHNPYDLLNFIFMHWISSPLTPAGVLHRVDQPGCTCCCLHEEDNIQMLGLLQRSNAEQERHLLWIVLCVLRCIRDGSLH